MSDHQGIAANLNRPFQNLNTNSTMFSNLFIHIIVTFLTFLVPVLTGLYVQKDYRAFISLGPGGTPATPLGYLKIKLLSLICLRDPHRPIPIPSHFRPQRGYFTDDALLRRVGETPEVRGIAPQRQQTQKSSGKIYAHLVENIKGLAADSRNQLVERTSCFEKHSSGLFASIPITRTCGGEICHAHPSDGSMHMTMHPADANYIIEKGWGERHPLARGGWCRRFVPREFMLVYAPRSESEVDIVMRIVSASVWWISGLDINGDQTAPRRQSADVAAIGKAMEARECWTCKSHGSTVGKLVGDA